MPKSPHFGKPLIRFSKTACYMEYIWQKRPPDVKSQNTSFFRLDLLNLLTFWHLDRYISENRLLPGIHDIFVSKSPDVV